MGKDSLISWKGFFVLTLLYSMATGKGKVINLKIPIQMSI